MVSTIMMASDGYYISTVRLRSSLADRAKSLAEELGISMNMLIGKAVEEYVARNTPSRKLLVLKNGHSKMVAVIELNNDGLMEVCSHFSVEAGASSKSVLEEAKKRTGVQDFDVVRVQGGHHG